MNDAQRAQVLSLMSAWGYGRSSIGAITPILDVYRVETPDGPKNLKWTRHPDEKLIFIISALRYLSVHGFRCLRLPIPTKAGAPYLIKDGQHYLLSDWIEGRQIDASQPDQLADACATLARFHRASHGYKPPPGANGRPRWGMLLIWFEAHCAEIQNFPYLAVAHGHLTPFDRQIQEMTEYYLDLALFSRELLAHSMYRQMAAEAARVGGLCHGDVAARNFIVTAGGDVCMIDFDGLNQDLALVDLWKLFRRTMKASNWNMEVGLKIIEGYERVAPLAPSEIEVLLALIAFPQKFWRLANRYYSGRYVIDEERFARKLAKFTVQRRAHAAFLSRLAGLCRERGATKAWPPAFFAKVASFGRS